jgi:hypothetical protein
MSRAGPQQLSKNPLRRALHIIDPRVLPLRLDARAPLARSQGSKGGTVARIEADADALLRATGLAGRLRSERADPTRSVRPACWLTP